MAAKSKLEPADPSDITQVEIDRWKRLMPIRRKLDVTFGKGQWRDGDVDATIRQWILEKRIRKANPPPVTEGKIKYDAANRARTVQHRMENYLLQYRDVTPNDRIMFGELAELETQLEELTDGGQFSKITDPAAQAKARSEASALRLKVIAAHRQIQSDLGIGRTQREQELEGNEQLRNLAAGGRALLNKYAVMISCPKCRAPTRLNQGLILFHFKDHVPWRWSSLCPNPKCRAEILIQGGPETPTEVETPPDYDTPRLEAPDAQTPG